jgi:membrane-associated protease RseP (regulator of RpoE activity)
MRVCASVLLTLIALSPALSGDPPKEATIAGMSLAKVPPLLYAQFPKKLTKDQGLHVEKVAPDSLGKKMGFEPHDIILSMGGVELKDAGQFARLLVALGDNTKVSILREGQKVSLALNLKLAEMPKGLAKENGLPDVTLKAEALGNNEHCLNLRFYAEGSGKLEEKVFKGSLGKIQTEVRDLAAHKGISTRVHQFVESALSQLKASHKSK